MPAKRSSPVPMYALALAVLSAIGALAWWSLRAQESHPSAERYALLPPAGGELPRLWQVPDFEYPDQHGASTTAATLRGKPWVADFVFTQCTSACPMMTSRLVLLQRQLTGAPLHFVSFSVDPAHDTQAALARYAESWNETETRWSLLATDSKRLPDTLSGFRVSAKPTGDPNDPIVHSSVFLLIDADGWVRGAYESEDAAARTRLVADARVLAAAAEVAPARPATLAALGCLGCHSNPRVAPDLAGLFGAEVTLQDGMKRIADEPYLRRSILDPAGELVRGYAPLMPSYAAQLSEAEVTALVEQLRTLKTADGASRALAAPAELAHDPVCHMTVRASPDALHTRHGDHDVYFCSEACREAFVRDPARFAQSSPPKDAGARHRD